jgi:hypothetical protein
MSSNGEYSAYRDAEGQLQLTLSCVLFFDILGTTQMSLAPEAVKHLRALRPALEAAVTRAGTDERVFGQASTWFTDNAVVATPLVDGEISEAITGGMEVAAAYLLLVCWERGFLGRGAISVGPHYMDERFVFGPALIEAVELEKSAKWPRVVLGPDAVAVERHHSQFYANALNSAQSTCLTRDEEDVVFVDHLGIYIDEEHNPTALDHFLTLHRKATEAGLAAHSVGSPPWEKWRWLAEYQNHALMSRHAQPHQYMVNLPEQRHEFRDFLDEAPYTPPGSPWYVLDRQPRIQPDILIGVDFLPETAGVYAFYRGGTREYVGASRNVLRRVRDEHLGQNATARNSALRRNLAELLGIATAADLRAGRYRLATAEIQRIRDWLHECEISWQECTSEAAARALAAELKRHDRPPLNRT